MGKCVGVNMWIFGNVVAHVLLFLIPNAHQREKALRLFKKNVGLYRFFAS